MHACMICMHACYACMHACMHAHAKMYLEPITDDELAIAITTWADTRPGLDGLWPKEACLLSRQARGWIITLLYVIEQGATCYACLRPRPRLRLRLLPLLSSSPLPSPSLSPSPSPSPSLSPLPSPSPSLAFAFALAFAFS